MRLFHFIAIIFFVFSSACSVTTTRSLSFDKSAAVAIEKAITDIDLPSKLTNAVSKTDFATIESIEYATTVDNELSAVIEDVLITSFVNAGYKIMDRDYDMMLRNLINSGKMNGANVSFNYSDKENPILEVNKAGGFLVTPTNKVISYRVKEAGIIYSNLDSTANIVDRNASVIMSIRVEDPTDNKILLSQTFQGNHTDRIPADSANHLENLHYAFKPYTYPVSNPNKQMTNIALQERIKGDSNSGFVIAAATGAIVILTVIVAASR